MTEIRYCPSTQTFTLAETKDSISVRPLKYSGKSKYTAYRRKALEKERKTRGLL